LEIVRILKNIGFEVNVLFGSQSGGAKEWKEIPKAQFNLVISPWVGVNIVKHLGKNIISLISYSCNTCW
jgi:nitrogenase molybdenum-iron protein beta chain